MVESKWGITPGRSDCRAALADEFREVWDGCVACDGEPGPQVVPERDAELGASFGDAEEGVAAVSAVLAAGAAADLSLGDLAADVVFGAVGGQRDFGPIEHHQQFCLL